MPETKRLMGLNGEHWRQTTVGSLVTALVTVSGFVGYMQFSPPRPDPFTGVEATALRRELEDKLQAQKKTCEQRFATVERQNEQLASAQSEIWRAIERLPPSTFVARVDTLEERLRDLEIYTVKHDSTFKPHD